MPVLHRHLSNLRVSELVRERGLFDTLVGTFYQHLSPLPDKRIDKNIRYGMEDAALSAFSMFFIQMPSFLAYQRKMANSKGKSNTQSLFGVRQIPSDNQIRNLLDGFASEQIFSVFEEILQGLDEQEGQLDGVRSMSDTLLVSMDSMESAVLNTHLEVRGHPLEECC